MSSAPAMLLSNPGPHTKCSSADVCCARTARFVLDMLKQRQERASTNAYRCSHSAAHQIKQDVKCSQEGCLQQHASSQGPCTHSYLCNSLERASNIYRHSVNRRQSWDGRVYHHPALLSPSGNRQLRHRNTERVNKGTAANCCGCWLDKPPAVAEGCMQYSAEELELVSLLQDISDCWSPDGWLPVTQGARSCRPQLVQGSNHAACQQPSRKRSNCSTQSTTAGGKHTQPAAGVTQWSAVVQPIVNISVPASSAVHTVELVANGMTPAGTCRGSHSMALGANVTDMAPASTSAPADPPQGNKAAADAQAESFYVTHESTAAEAGSALCGPKAAVAEADIAYGNQDGDAATMAAWLVQKPHLLQGVLGHLERLASSVVGKSSAATPSSDPPAGLLASSTAADKLSVDGTIGIRGGMASSLPAASFATAQPAAAQPAGQPLSCSSASAAMQEWGGLEAAASPSVSQATATADSQQPQYLLSSQHKASADAEMQQSDRITYQSNHSVMGLYDLHQQEAMCASTSQQQQFISSHVPGLSKWQSGGEDHQGSCRGASCPTPAQATDGALPGHCAAGRYDEARAVLRKGAEVDTADAEGNTLLMLACRAGHGRLVKLLVRKGAKLDALNTEGKTAEQLATYYCHKGIATFLQESYGSSHWQSEA